MDLMKTLLVYMMLVVGSATETVPAVTPPPAQPAATAYSFITAVPTAVPTRIPTAVPTRVPTQAPTPAPTPAAYTTLYVGDRGEDVRKLQRRLAELGYLTDKIDGIYGQNTKRAVERFQYYNNLTVDGIAGKATQRVLFESRSVVIAPPEITAGPTPSPTPMTSVIVPVYYVDQNGLLLKRVDMTCYGTTTIYANGSNAGKDYTLISASSVVVSIRNGIASPASVTFRYQKKAAPTEAPATIVVPVYYMTDTGAILYQSTATLPRNAVSFIPVNTSLVPDYYELISSVSVTVSVNAAGVPDPASVIFTFRNATPTPVPGASPTPLPEYAALYERNHDFFGWISVEGTNVDLPVMYAPDRPLQYLGHDFDGKFSYAGVPYVEPECDPKGRYLLVYGHHMRDGTVFAGLLNYEDPAFWAEHPTFRFDTRFEHRTYAVVVAFRARVLLQKEKGFRYYNYFALDDENTFREFMTGIRAMAAYDTGVETSLGDEILTLSTCAYHVDNGRFVVVAKRVE